MPRQFHDIEDPSRLRSALEAVDAFVDDRDRRRWLPAGAFVHSTLAYDSMSVGGTAGFFGLEMADATNTAATATLAVPSTWVNGDLAVTGIIGNRTAASGNVMFGLRLAGIGAGAAGTTTLVYLAATTAPAQDQIALVEPSTTHAVTGNDDLILVNVSRIGGDAGDTLAGDLLFFGALLTFTPS